jgi:hypothetical protein
MNNIIKLYLLLFLFLASSLAGQEKRCAFCGRKIEKEYIVVDGKAFHKNHFKCANCNKPIDGSYAKKNGKYYDQKCYAKLFMLKCGICNKPINGEYLIDSYGLKYHKYHETELKRCDNCNRLISNKSTKGGVKYSDGRNICNICNGKKLTSLNQYKHSLNQVIGRLNNYGLQFNKQSIKLKIVDLTELQEISGNLHSKSINGFTFTEVETTDNKKTFTHTIYILSGIPPKYAESTIAHELMHVWIAENIKHKLSMKLLEGSCNYVSYIYLASDYSNDAKDIIIQLKRNPDKIYGDGFRAVSKNFKGRDFNLFLNYIKKNKTI